MCLLSFTPSRRPIMATATGLRQRNVAGASKKNGTASASEVEVDKLLKAKSAGGSEIDYKIALTIITILAFVTRFWGISHPDEVVFDEVHFGKVCSSTTTIAFPWSNEKTSRHSSNMCD